jgi:class 3 adenylate cyclase
VLRGDVLAALLCLGRKVSGDIYTSTDRALLLVVASQLSVQLLRFGERELLAEAQSMQERLRRWVPGSVADELARGHELDPVEREVSILFVDIRGYASFAEGRPAAEIFSTVNRYTQAVSQAVRDHGGTVVEFNGDGMMAVFGAPEPLADKERCAVAAARQITQSMASLSAAADAVLRVGVGIATGAAYVGAIHSVDRWIWSAIGNTTNLAARLQGLARDLDADVVIDGATRRRAGPAADGVELHPRLAIRGLRDAHDVYALRVTGRAVPSDAVET